MDFEELSKLNKEFAEQTKQMSKEFTELFTKWLKKSPRLSCINALHLPINSIVQMLLLDDKNLIPEILNDFPEVFERFLKPFTIIKDKWGKVSSKEFADLYYVEYQKQFDKFFASDEEQKNFQDWFKEDSEKHKNK